MLRIFSVFEVKETMSENQFPLFAGENRHRKLPSVKLATLHLNMVNKEVITQKLIPIPLECCFWSY